MFSIIRLNAKKIEKYVFKFTTNFIYNFIVELKKDVSNNNKVYFSKAIIINKDAYKIILKRETEETKEERRKVEEKEIKKRER
jgi:hypothetical protein